MKSLGLLFFSVFVMQTAVTEIAFAIAPFTVSGICLDTLKNKFNFGTPRNQYTLDDVRIRQREILNDYGGTVLTLEVYRRFAGRTPFVRLAKITGRLEMLEIQPSSIKLSLRISKPEDAILSRSEDPQFKSLFNAALNYQSLNFEIDRRFTFDERTIQFKVPRDTESVSDYRLYFKAPPRDY